MDRGMSVGSGRKQSATRWSLSGFAGLRNSRGWSLVELGVVFLVIGVMTGAAIPRLIAMRRNARIKATVEDLLVLSNVVGDYARRCTKPNGAVTSIPVIAGAGRAGAGGLCTADPMDMIRFMIPSQFKGINPYGNPYSTRINYLGGVNSDVNTWTCVPAEDFLGYQHPTGRVFARCPSAAFGCAECELVAFKHVVATGIAAAVQQETAATHPGFPPSDVGQRGLPGK